MLLSDSVHTHKAALLTTTDLVASVRTVPLAVTDVVSRDTLTALACGLIRSAGSGWAGEPRGLLGGGGCGGRGGEDWRDRPFYFYNKSLIKLQMYKVVTSSGYCK